MIQWRRVVQAYPCLVCGSPPGLMCVTASGKPTYLPHYLRSQAASAHDWRSPDEDLESSVEHVRNSGHTS